MRPSRTNRTRSSVLAGAAACVALVGGCAVPHRVSAAVRDTPSHTAALPAPRTHGSAASSLPARRAIRDVLSRADRSVVLDATVKAGTPSAGPGVTVAVTVTAPKSDEIATIKAEWEADLFCGAVAEAMAGSETHLKNVVGMCVTSARRPDGSVVPLGGGFGNAAAHQEFTDASDADISTDVARAARASHMTVESLQILRPRDAAIAVRLSAPSEASAAANFHKLNTMLHGEPARYEGVYLQVDVNGKPYGGVAGTPRVGGGGIWGPPEITGRSGIHPPRSTPAETETP